MVASGSNAGGKGAPQAGAGAVHDAPRCRRRGRAHRGPAAAPGGACGQGHGLRVMPQASATKIWCVCMCVCVCAHASQGMDACRQACKHAMRASMQHTKPLPLLTRRQRPAATAAATVRRLPAGRLLQPRLLTGGTGLRVGARRARVQVRGLRLAGLGCRPTTCSGARQLKLQCAELLSAA